MEGTGNGSGGLMRLVGLMGFFVGMAWLVQVLGFPPRDGVAGEFLWVIGAALISGASLGLILAEGLPETRPPALLAVRRMGS